MIALKNAHHDIARHIVDSHLPVDDINSIPLAINESPAWFSTTSDQQFSDKNLARRNNVKQELSLLNYLPQLYSFKPMVSQTAVRLKITTV